MPKQYQNEIIITKVVRCIKDLRQQKSITLEVFYFDTGIHLARIEQGKQNITISTLSKICEYFEISLSDFFLLMEESDKML